MKPFSRTLALLSSVALCLSVHAQDLANPSPTAAPPASVAAASTTPVPLSDIRIVRLSQVRGVVQIDRHIGRSYEDAFANIPITTGTLLRTQVGLAVVEFEDNSTIRLTPDSEVIFTALKRTPSGSTISDVTVLRGMVYATLANTKGNTFTVTAGNASVDMNPSSHMRLAVESPLANLTVLDGAVQLTVGSSTTTVTRKTATGFEVSGSKPAIPLKLVASAFDEWDKNGNEYQKQYSSLRSAASSGPAFGLSDLNYYGSFVNMPGCGSVWQPYFVSAAWSPYDNGSWAWYPNVGYSWVSPYPWGWLPFHSGNWVSCGGSGWGWHPGGSFTGLQNTGLLNAARANRPVPTAPAPPRRGVPAMVPVNNRPLAVSSVTAPGTFTFRKDSAGLGVPRDGFGQLKHISSDVVRHGEMNTEIQRSVIGPASGFRNGRTENGAQPNPAFAPGSRSVATFGRPGSDAHSNVGPPSGWSDMPGGMRSSQPANSSFPRGASQPMRAPSAPASAPAGGTSHK
jgi:hypothetical protein